MVILFELPMMAPLGSFHTQLLIVDPVADTVMVFPGHTGLCELVAVIAGRYGENPVTTLEAAPMVFVTSIGPLVLPEGNTAEMVVALITVKEVASMPLNLTEVTPVKLEPVSVIV
jgi:hypothetical protein